MSAIGLQPAGRVGVLRGELAKLPAFVRRDFLVAWSYRASFVSDIVGLVGQVLVFAFISQMIDRITKTGRLLVATGLSEGSPILWIAAIAITGGALLASKDMLGREPEPEQKAEPRS